MTQPNTAPAERLWTYDAVQVGQAGAATEVAISAADIAEYAACAQNPDPRYQPAASASNAVAAAGAPLMAMPTMALTYAPLLRDEIADANGFTAQERSATARRQTPFAKCEIRWYRTVHAGETIIGNRRVSAKYERRGSKFVTFRVSAFAASGAVVASYDYTCIFEYAAGQRTPPAADANPDATAIAPDTDAVPDPAQFLAWDDARAGVPLPRTLAVGETTDNILRKNAQRLAGRPSPSNIHTDEEFARQNIFGGAVNAGPATLSYVDRFLGLNFAPEALYNGGSLLMRAITPFRAGDVVTFSGAVTGAGGNLYGQRKVQCRIRGVNQRDELVCLADATLTLG